ncbi:TonB-dependent receptor [Alkalimonas collagenimarina]|uniref:TonB-dependent receptor n=1 Tax=Alkalimonas collagenimarina TaxID=400390 RepID=A0ABT9H002_9GAMM|nr:TonB-dependent receptor [Alkalimonas collagenimarina]MDP4536641.1 TonB-dependent receptor [Alkalimonas collagenimarina]
MTTGHYKKSLLALAVMSACSIGTQVYADTDTNDGENASNRSMEVIAVTGTRIMRRGETEASPIQTIDRSELDLKGALSLGEVLQEMPSVGASLNDNGSAGISHGTSSINLRNLGDNRSLVLVNGNRWVNGAGTRGFRDFVDLNTIPFAMIDRVEVLQDGATAIYGADAIAGVVNIHTFKDFTGVHTRAYYGQTSESDRETVNLDLRLGHDLGNHNLMFVASYSDQKPILTQDRELTAIPLNGLSLGTGEGLFRSNALSSVFGFDIPAQGITREPGTDGNQLASWRPASTNDRFNRYHDNYVVGPSKRLSLYGQGVFELGQLGFLQDTSFRVEAVYNKRESDQQFSAVIPTVNGSRGFVVPNNPLVNPFGVELSGSDFVATNFFVNNGLRVNAQKVETTRLGFGFEGYTAGDWHWDLFASFARNKGEFTSNNQLHLDKLALGMRACDSTGITADISDLIAGCVPVNLFNTLTPDMVNYINFTGYDSNEAKQQHVRFNVTNSIFDLPAGDVMMAAGMEYRKETGTDVPDSIINSDARVNTFRTTSSAPRTGTEGSYDLYEAYAELSIPLLANHQLARYLEVNLASRFSDYSTFGSTVNSKAGILYRPVDDLMIRATWAEGFRAPSLLELYEGERESFAPVNDPCSGGASLPGCSGVPADYSQNEAAVPIRVGGNILLEPETSENISMGVVYTPSQLDGFSLTLDWYNIQIDNTISSFGSQNLLDLCATTNRNCGVIQRSASGQITNIIDGPVNLNKTEVSGMDAVVRYAFNTDHGRWNLSANLSRLGKFVESSTLPDGTFVEVDKKGTAASREAFPEWRGFLSAQWNQDAWNAGYTLRYIGDTTETFAGEPLSIGSMVYHSVSAGYNFDNGIGIKLGVNNLLDKQPPTSRTNLNINFDQQTYNAIGRFMYVQVSYDF